MFVRIREIFSLYIARGNVKLFSDVVWWVPQNLSIELAYDPVTIFRLYFQRLKSETQTNTYTSMVIAAHITVAKKVETGTSLMVQWLRVCFQYRGQVFDPWWGN